MIAIYTLLSRKFQLVFWVFIGFAASVQGQMRKIFSDTSTAQHFQNFSFYTSSEGYAASTGITNPWVGYTTDTGRTFTKKFITLSNVNWNGYSPNLTFGFYPNGVKAFDKNNLIVFGDYGFVPAILTSSNGGNSFTLVFLSQLGFIPNTSVVDMAFAVDGVTGYAIDADRVLKTTNKGISWSVVRIENGSAFDRLIVINKDVLFVYSTYYASNRMLRSTDGGNSWQSVSLPANEPLIAADFLDANKGWLILKDQDTDAGKVFYTSNGGAVWSQKNNTRSTPFACLRMKFINDSTGFAIGGFTTFTTNDSGKIWEPIPRDNAFSYLGYQFNNMHIYANNQLWCGGDLNFLELNTDLKGATLPRAYFDIDTAGYDQSGKVLLKNYSKKKYVSRWYVNDSLISESYDATYTHVILRTCDTVRLVVSNGLLSDTLTRLQYFYPPVIVASFRPDAAATDDTVVITGENFSGLLDVRFGGVSSKRFRVLSDKSIEAVVGNGASGNVKVITSTGRGERSGFTYIPAPEIASFSPMAATAGTAITITGKNFSGTTSVSFGGVGAASFTVISPTTIVAVTPSGPSGNLEIIARGGRVSIGDFKTLPSLLSFFPLVGTEGTVLQIVGTSLDEISSITIGGIPVNEFQIDSSRKITAIVGPGASGKVEIRSAYGSSIAGDFTWLSAPVITGFQPALGPAGTRVTITGIGFDPDTLKNTVYFGSVQARVVAASTNVLQVIVPVGAIYAPISVTRDYLVALSSKPFLLTFSGGGSITPHSFADRRLFSTAAIYFPTNITMADLDRDGRNDLLFAQYTSLAADVGMLIFRNSSMDTSLRFEEPLIVPGMNVDYTSANGIVADFDGDGWLDMIGVSGDNLAVFRNISTQGHIAFDKPVLVPCQGTARGLTVSDVDGDGKVDVAACFIPEKLVSVFKNTSEPGTVRFRSRVDYSVKGGRNVLAVDIDQDDKPDLIIADGENSSFNVLKNQCTKRRIDFGTPQSFPGFPGAFMSAGDIDNDGKADLVVADRGGSRIALLRNSTQQGTIQWESPRYFETQSAPWGVTLGDLDGDSSIDIAVALMNRDVTIFKNRSKPGLFSLLPPVNYTSGYFDAAHQLAIGDLDGDGRNDIVAASEYEPSLAVYRSKVVAEPYLLSFTPTIGEEGTAVHITGGKFSGVQSVYFGNTPASSFTVESDTSLTAIVGAGTTGDITVSNDKGTGVIGPFVYGFPPVITAVSPLKGPVGTRVTLKGDRLVAGQSNPLVRFGKVQANLISARPQELIVEVPAGTSLETISVTAGKRIGYASPLFAVTFNGGVDSFTEESFEPRIDRYGGICVVDDLDGDGRPDLISGARQQGIRVIRNTGNPGFISFAADQFFGNGNSYGLLATGDLDGDGDVDVAALNASLGGVTLFKNESTNGVMSLIAGASFTNSNGYDPSDIEVRDVDADGKPDVVVVNYSYGNVVVYRNISNTDSLRLDEPIVYGINGYGNAIVLADLDGDALPELIVATSGGINVMKNSSRPGQIRFQQIYVSQAGSTPSDVAVADMDGDGRMDIVLSNYGSSNLSLFLNTTTNGQLTFSDQQFLQGGAGPWGLSLGDLDGDGKVDISEQNLSSDNLTSLIKNKSTPGNIIVSPRVDYKVATSPSRSTIADMDSDGRPDMVIYIQGAILSVFRNRIGWTDTLYFSAGMDTVLKAGISGTAFQWQVNKGSGFANITDNTNYAGTATATLSLNNVQLAWQGNAYRCIINGDRSSRVSLLNVVPMDTIHLCATRDTVMKAGLPGLSFQWQVNKGTGFTNITDDINYSGATTGTLTLKNIPFSWNNYTYYCVINGKRASQAKRLQLLPILTPVITISGDTVVETGQFRTLTAKRQQGGTKPYFQWQDSTLNHKWQAIAGANDSIINYRPQQTNDKIRCIMASNAPCAVPDTVISNSLKFTVQAPTGLDPEPGRQFGIILFPNPVVSSVTLEGFKRSDQWRFIEVFNGLGQRVTPLIGIHQRPSVCIDLSKLANGTYTLVCYGVMGKRAYFKIMKWQ